MESILEEAQRLTDVDRHQTYGHFLDDYTRTANIWSAWLGDQLREPLTAEQAITMMALMKVSRERYKHGRDNLVDSVGYLKGVQETIEERERRAQGISSGTVSMEGQAQGARCIP